TQGSPWSIRARQPRTRIRPSRMPLFGESTAGRPGQASGESAGARERLGALPLARLPRRKGRQGRGLLAGPRGADAALERAPGVAGDAVGLQVAANDKARPGRTLEPLVERPQHPAGPAVVRAQLLNVDTAVLDDEEASGGHEAGEALERRPRGLVHV